MEGTTAGSGSPDDYSLFLSENGHLSFENPNYQFKPIGRIDAARMEDHLNSNVDLDPSVPMSVYQELYQELETQRGLSRGNTRTGSRKAYASMDITSMGVDLERGPLTNLDNKLASELAEKESDTMDTNKMSQSIAEKTAKLHRLLGDSDKEKCFHLDLESPESEKLTDSVSEKEEKDVDELDEDEKGRSFSQNQFHQTTGNNDMYALPIRRRQKMREELPPGWERHEDSDGAYYWHILSGTIQRDPPTVGEADTQDQVSNLIRNVRSSRIFEPSFDANRSFESDFIPSTGMQKSCTASSIVDLGKERLVKEEKIDFSKKEDEKWKRRSLPAGKVQDDAAVSTGSGTGGFKRMQVMVVSLGWCELADEDLTPENSSKAVNRCIVDLSTKDNEFVKEDAVEKEASGVWGGGRDLVLELDEGSLKLIDPDTGACLNSQAIHAIRVWGVGRDNGRDFAYVSRAKISRKHMCHVFRCQVPARTIANALRDICKKILIERSLAQSSSKLTDKLVSVSERRERMAMARPTSLNVEAKLNKLARPGSSSGQTISETFPTPMEEPRKVIKAWYLGCLQVDTPGGMEVINTAINDMIENTDKDDWSTVSVAVAPSTVSVAFHDGRESMECRVRFLSFLGIGQNVQQCAFIMHTAQNTFICHVFHCEPTAGPLCKTIEAACKLRYQKCLDARPASSRGEGAEGATSRNSIGATIKNLFGGFRGRGQGEPGDGS